MLIQTNALNNPLAFKKWLKSAIDNPIIQSVSTTSFALLGGAFAFVTGVVYGAMIAGPVAGFINAFLEPLLRPIREKGAVTGTKLFGSTGKMLNRFLFDAKTVDKSTPEMEGINKTVGEMRALIENATYEISPEQWAENMKNLQAKWNHFAYVWNKMPDVYRNGRDRISELLVYRPRDFATAITTSVNAAETHMQGAEAIVDRIMLKSEDKVAVEKLANDMLLKIEEQIRTERTNTPQAEVYRQQVEVYKSEMIQLGASEPQATRLVENYRRAFVFTRQAANNLASQVFVDAQFTDMLAEARTTVEALRDSYVFRYFHNEMAAEVKSILANMQFDLDVKAKDVAESRNEKAAHGSGENKASSIVSKTLATGEAAKVLQEAGALGRKVLDTPEERVREAVGRAARR